jgi:UDP-N-acetylglucosamine:LPS N-acetylglucosamine transferase
MNKKVINGKGYNIINLFDEFISFETENNLLDGSSDVSLLWEKMRFYIFTKILNQLEVTVPAHNPPVFKGKKTFFNKLKHLTINNPFLSLRRPKYLIFSHPRRKEMKDGNYYDIYTDPICEQLPTKDYVVIERKYFGSNLEPVRTKNIKYLDVFEHIELVRNWIKRRLEKYLSVNIKTEKFNLDADMERLQTEIQKRFNLVIDFEKVGRNHYYNSKINIKRYRAILSWFKPEVIILVVSYVFEDLILVAKEMKIPVVELQHGIIHKYHAGYSYPHNLKKRTFPDYMLTFGSIWREVAEMPIYENNVITFGFPFISKKVFEYRDVQKKNQIIFLSQGNVGAQISQEAIRFSERDRKIKIIYKLHPGEYSIWKERYPELYENHKKHIITVIDSDQPELHKILAESKYVVGVNSTTIFEGLRFGCRAIILKIEGFQSLDWLIERGLCKLVDADSHWDLPEERAKDKSIEYLFSIKPCDIVNVLEKIINAKDC